MNVREGRHVRTYIFFGCHKSPRASKSPKKQKAACWPSAARSLRVKRSAQKALKASSKENHSLTHSSHRKFGCRMYLDHGNRTEPCFDTRLASKPGQPHDGTAAPLRLFDGADGESQLSLAISSQLSVPRPAMRRLAQLID